MVIFGNHTGNYISIIIIVIGNLVVHFQILNHFSKDILVHWTFKIGHYF